MRILVIADLYPSAQEPVAGVFIKEQVEQLKKYHDVYVMVMGRKFVGISIRNILKYIFEISSGKVKTKQPAGKSDNENDVLRIKYPVFTMLGKSLHIFDGLSLSLTSLRGFRKTGFYPDLIYAQKSYPAGFAGWKLKKRLKVPVMTMEFQGPFSGYFKDPRQGRRVMNTIKNIDRTVYTGTQINNIRSYGIREEKLGVACFGVDTDRFSFDSEYHERRRAAVKKGQIRLLVVGRIEEAKGFKYLFEAVQILKNKYPQACLDIVGPVDNGGAQFLNYAEENGLENHIQYKGVCSNEELPSVIREHDILVSASLHETLGITIIEAMSCGKPVVATKCGGPEESVNRTAGVLVEKADSKALAEGICHVIEHYEQYNPEKIREYVVQNFSHGIAVKRLNRFFGELVTGK